MCWQDTASDHGSNFLIIPLIFGFGAASTALVGVHFGADKIKRAHQFGWTAALYAAAMCGLIGVAAALAPKRMDQSVYGIRRGAGGEQ